MRDGLVMFTAVTVSIPERHESLARAGASLRAQTYGPVPWLVRVEEPPVFGVAHVVSQRRALLPAVQTPWMAVLDDDDTLAPTYLERVAEAIANDPRAAVVYTFCCGHAHTEGAFDADRLQRENYIDGEAVISMEWLQRAGGYPDGPIVEDWQLWKRIDALGGRFVCVPERLRFHGRAARNVTN